MTIAFALTGDISMNSRALKQFRVWAGMGMHIKAFGFEMQNLPPEWGDFVEWQVLPKPKGSGVRFFRAVDRLFTQTLSNVKADVYHASDLYVLPALAKARKKQGGKLVFDSRELYPYVASTAGRPWVSLYWHGITYRHIRKCDAVLTVNESIAERLSILYGVDKPVVLYNVPDYRPTQPSDYLSCHLKIAPQTKILLHQGKMQQSRGCALLVNAMQEVKDAVLVFLGDGALESVLKKQVEKLGLKNVFFLPPVAPNELLAVTAGADVGITLLEDTCLNHHFALPNKLFEYLSVGVPVLASNLPEISKVVQQYEVGQVVNPSDHQALVETMQRMISDDHARKIWQQNAPNVFKQYHWDISAERLKNVYTQWIKD